MSNRVSINKTQLKAALVAERKMMRATQKQSELLRRTLSIYKGMVKRAEEKKKTLNFTLWQFRRWVDEFIGKQCHYCTATLTVKSFTPDHWEPIVRDGSFDLENLFPACKSCNWRKGMMDGNQFKTLTLWVEEHLSEPEKSDFWRRLVIGGKWAGKL